MKSLLSSPDAPSSTVAYGGCGLSYVVAYIQQIDWLALLSTVLMVSGMVWDWYNKQKKKENERNAVEQQIKIVKDKHANDTMLKAEYYEEQVRLLSIQVNAMREQNEELMKMLINKKFEEADT